MKLILGSNSQSRKKILEAVGLCPEIVPADIDETAIKGETFEVLAINIAKAKAEEIAKSNDNAVIITADTFVVIDGEQFLKTNDIELTKQKLKKLSGKTHQAITGVCVLNSKTKKTITKLSKVEVTLRNLSDEEINEYVKLPHVLRFPGAFSPSDGKSHAFVEKIEGDLTDHYFGLPLSIVIDMVKSAGYKFF